MSKDFDRDAIDKAIEALKCKGYLDDYKFAFNWVQSRLRNKLDSYNGLLSSLIKKGVAVPIIKDVLQECYNDEIESDILKKSVDKCCRMGKSSDKIINTLLRKGFNRNKVLYFVNHMENFNEGY